MIKQSGTKEEDAWERERDAALMDSCLLSPCETFLFSSRDLFPPLREPSPPLGNKGTQEKPAEKGTLTKPDPLESIRLFPLTWVRTGSGF